MRLRSRPGFLVILAAAGFIAASLSQAGTQPHNYRDKNFDYFVAGDPSRPRARHTEFALALMGGGGNSGRRATADD